MTKKSDFIEKLMKEIVPRWPVPAEPKASATLLEQGVILVLMRHMTQSQAESSLAALNAAYEDWNEARVSQVQELAAHLRTGSRKKGHELLKQNRPAAVAMKAYLQDVFQQTHGLDLEFMREGPPPLNKGFPELLSLGQSGMAYLMWVADDGQLPVTGPLVKLLDRLDLIKRTSSTRKARDSILPLIPKGQTLRFVVTLYEVAEHWNDPDAPAYETHPVLRECPAGKKAYTDRSAMRERQEIHRKKSEQRRIVQEKKEEERQRKELERDRKRSLAEAKRQSRELEKRTRAAARKRVEEARKREIERQKVADVKRIEAEKKKQLAANKKDEARRAAAEKKAAAKQAAAAKKKATGKGAAPKKAAAKQRPAKKKVSKPAKMSKPKAAARSKPKKQAKKKTAKKKSSTSTKSKGRRR